MATGFKAKKIEGRDEAEAIVAVPKVRFATALSEVAAIIEQVEDNEGNVPDELIPIWDTAVGSLAEAVDRRAAFILIADAQAKTFRDMAEGFRAKAKALEAASERVRASTKEYLLATGIEEAKGKLNTFKIQVNGGVHPIKWNVELQKMDRIIDPSQVSAFPQEYVRKHSVFVLSPFFDKDLREGRFTCEGAELGPRGEHLRVK